MKGKERIFLLFNCECLIFCILLNKAYLNCIMPSSLPSAKSQAVLSRYNVHWSIRSFVILFVCTLCNWLFSLSLLSHFQCMLVWHGMACVSCHEFRSGFELQTNLFEWMFVRDKRDLHFSWNEERNSSGPKRKSLTNVCASTNVITI